MNYSLRIADLPTTERPRERLLQIGAKHLGTAELLAILLGTGQGAGKLSAVGLGQYLLKQLGTDQRDPLEVLREISPQELMAIPGVGPAKATTISAAVELGKRAFQVRPNERTMIDSPDAAAAALSQDLMWQTTERFAVLLCSFIIRCQTPIIRLKSYYHRHGNRNFSPSARNFPGNHSAWRNTGNYCSQSSHRKC